MGEVIYLEASFARLEILNPSAAKEFVTLPV